MATKKASYRVNEKGQRTKQAEYVIHEQLGVRAKSFTSYRF